MTVLEITDLSTNGEWETLDVPQLEAGYRAVTEWHGEDTPAGLNIVVARLAFTRGGRPLPTGGVLLGIDLVAFSPPPSDGRFEFMTTTDITAHRSGKPLVRATTRLRVPGCHDVADVTFTIRWPGE